MNKDYIVSVVVLFGFLVLGGVGCKTFATPSGVLEIALEALQKNDLEKFNSTLYGAALVEYGSPQGVDQLRQRLSQYVNFETANQQKISNIKTGPNQWLATSTVDVLGASLAEVEPHLFVGTATVLCWSKMVIIRRPKRRVEQKKKTDCRISDFKS